MRVRTVAPASPAVQVRCAVLAGRLLGPLLGSPALCGLFKGPEPPVVTSGHPGQTHMNQRLSVAQGCSGGAVGTVELVGCVTNRVAHGSPSPLAVVHSHWGTGRPWCWVWGIPWGPAGWRHGFQGAGVGVVVAGVAGNPWCPGGGQVVQGATREVYGGFCVGGRAKHGPRIFWTKLSRLDRQVSRGFPRTPEDRYDR